MISSLASEGYPRRSTSVATSRKYPLACMRAVSDRHPRLGPHSGEMETQPRRRSLWAPWSWPRRPGETKDDLPPGALEFARRGATAERTRGSGRRIGGDFEERRRCDEP